MAALLWIVRVAVPLAPLMVVEEKAAVTPAGRVPIVRATGELKLFVATMLTVVLNVAPAVIASVVTSVLSVKPGTPRIVKSKLADWVTVPPTALMVSLY